MAADIQQLSWLGSGTKQNALTKLQSIANKIGYPDKWRDYSSVVISRNDFAGNVERATVSGSKRRLDEIGTSSSDRRSGRVRTTGRRTYG